MTTTRKAPAKRKTPATKRKAPAKRWTPARAWEEFQSWSTIALWSGIGGYWTMTTHKILFPLVIAATFTGIVALIRRASS